jgi:hypothetical protein
MMCCHNETNSMPINAYQCDQCLSMQCDAINVINATQINENQRKNINKSINSLLLFCFRSALVNKSPALSVHVCLVDPIVETQFTSKID